MSSEGGGQFIFEKTVDASYEPFKGNSQQIYIHVYFHTFGRHNDDVFHHASNQVRLDWIDGRFRRIMRDHGRSKNVGLQNQKLRVVSGNHMTIPSIVVILCDTEGHPGV